VDDTAPGETAHAKASETLALPAWLGRAAPAIAPGPARVSPSTGFDLEDEAIRTERMRSRAGTQARAALQRGRLVHRLVQALPDIAADRREDAARRMLARARPALDSTTIDATIAETLAVLDHPTFAPLFGPGSRAEVPIVGRIAVAGGPSVVVSGQIDRLSVDSDGVLIADFKTDGSPPERIEDIPPQYVRQLALYRAVLTRLYPNQTVRAAVVFTQAPRLIELSAAHLDDALTRVSGPRLDPLQADT
jgi:ATP-dependent helicase/nuclease subunit A